MCPPAVLPLSQQTAMVALKCLSRVQTARFGISGRSIPPGEDGQAGNHWVAPIASLPAVGKNWDGRLEVFAWGTDGALWHVWQNLPALNWSGWASFGGTCTSFPVVGLNRGGPLNNRLRYRLIGNDFRRIRITFSNLKLPGGGGPKWVIAGRIY